MKEKTWHEWSLRYWQFGKFLLNTTHYKHTQYRWQCNTKRFQVAFEVANVYELPIPHAIRIILVVLLFHWGFLILWTKFKVMKKETKTSPSRTDQIWISIALCFPPLPRFYFLTNQPQKTKQTYQVQANVACSNDDTPYLQKESAEISIYNKKCLPLYELFLSFLNHVRPYWAEFFRWSY